MKESAEITKSKALKNLLYKGVEKKKLVLTEPVLERIAHEFSIIEQQDFIDHFILYSRIAEVCNELNLIRSCGRSNAINSIVNYCLDITKINPIPENLAFENFIRPEQKNLPDIDIDIPVGYQEKVIERLKQKHPEYNIYPIAIKIEKDVDKYQKSEKVVFDNHSAYRIHPCGVIITHERLTDSTFIHNEQEFFHPNDVYNDPIYKNHKVDLLGLCYLNRLQFIVDEISEAYHPDKLPLNDKAVFESFASDDLENIFSFKDPDLHQIFKQHKPRSINDLLLTQFTLHSTFSKAHLLSCVILGYWGCYYKTHFRKEFDMAFSKELTGC